MKRNWTPLIISLILTILLIIAVFFVFIFQTKEREQPISKAFITVIPAPTSTPNIGLTIVPTPTIEITITPTNNYKFLIGDYVQISGTSGDGLRLRSNPGINTSVNFIGMDSEVFEIKDGPINQDGYTWWHLQAPYDKNRNGWAVDEFLQLVTVP